MRLVFVVAALAFAAYAALADVTYLRSGGYAADLPEHRRIDVVSAETCAAVVARAELTLGAHHGIVCQRVPLVRHWTNLTRDAVETRNVTGLALTVFRSEALASAAPADALR